MTTVGIVNTSWTVNRHNTDHRCVIDFSTMGDYVDDLSFQFIGSQVHYLQANINYVSERLLKFKLFKQINLSDKSLKTDVLYKYGGEMLGLAIDKKNKTPLISTLGFPTLNQDKLQGEQYLQNEADNLIRHAEGSHLVHFHTDCMREAFLLRKPEWRDKCISIPFFMPQLQFLSEQAITEKFSEEGVHIAFVGVDGQRKGLVDVCAALDSIADFLVAHQVSATIVSKTRHTCQKFNGVKQHVFLERDAVQKLMQASHLYVMVPHLESFGLVFVEAMAAGCAVIADDDVPRQEILQNSNCGKLVQAGNVSQIAEALKTLIEDRQAMLQLAQQGWRHAQARYSPSLVAGQYADVFRKLAVC
jgi:glycosyltransferase involved in cell wall biosynthesis